MREIEQENHTQGTELRVMCLLVVAPSTYNRRTRQDILEVAMGTENMGGAEVLLL